MPMSTLQRHILRCMVNYPGYVTCPYNALHRFKNKDILAKHMLSCDSKNKNIHEREYKWKDFTGDMVNVHWDKAREINLKEEDWDDEY